MAKLMTFLKRPFVAPALAVAALGASAKSAAAQAWPPNIQAEVTTFQNSLGEYTVLVIGMLFVMMAIMFFVSFVGNVTK